MSRAFFKDPFLLPRFGPDFVAHVNSDKLGALEGIGMAGFFGEANLVLEGLVAVETAGLVFPAAFLLGDPGLPLGGLCLGFSGGSGNFAGSSLPFTLAALRRAWFPGAGLDLVESCPVVAVLAFFLFGAVAAHFRPLVSAHFNNYNNQIFIWLIAV